MSSIIFKSFVNEINCWLKIHMFNTAIMKPVVLGFTTNLWYLIKISFVSFTIVRAQYQRVDNCFVVVVYSSLQSSMLTFFFWIICLDGHIWRIYFFVNSVLRFTYTFIGTVTYLFIYSTFQRMILNERAPWVFFGPTIYNDGTK